ncbi:hypothetical protein SK128_024976 [Halocaridina rubra]|uniref:Uncharacterized protein n=1 Tax=Halocaridina rubra TaxID=373956 RepID=A0AAN8X4L8_HALRR
MSQTQLIALVILIIPSDHEGQKTEKFTYLKINAGDKKSVKLVLGEHIRTGAVAGYLVPGRASTWVIPEQFHFPPPSYLIRVPLFEQWTWLAN